jgi:hypothetical protein
MDPSPFAFVLSDVAGDHYLTREGLFWPVEAADEAEDLLLFADEGVVQAYADARSPDGRPRLRVQLLAT